MEIGDRKVLYRLRRVMVRFGDLEKVDEEIKNGESNRQLLERIRKYTNDSTDNAQNNAHPVEAR